MNEALNIKLDNDTNNIANLEDILTALNDINNDLNSIEYLESLLNYLEFQEINNKDSLIAAIKAKLIEFKTLSIEGLDSNQVLDQIRKYNEDLKRINIIRTNKYDNDSKKDIEYISITHDDGSVEMLVCVDGTSIGEYIKEHVLDVATKSADEIFKYFKDTVHRDLKFYKESEIDDENPNLANQALVKEEDSKALEVEEVLKYAEKYDLGDDVRVTVDPNGERIYMVADAILKFHSDHVGNRVMDILQESKLSKKARNNYSDLIGELDSQENNDIFNNYSDSISANEVFGPSETSEFENIEFERIFPDFDIELLKSYIIRKQVYEEELSAAELMYITRSIAFLIESMVERYEAGDLYSEEEITLGDYMKDIVDKYEAIKEGRLDEGELSETDKQLASKYLENLEKIKSLGLNKKPKLLELKDAPKNSGVATMVILLEMVVIAAFVLLFLSIDI